MGSATAKAKFYTVCQRWPPVVLYGLGGGGCGGPRCACASVTVGKSYVAENKINGCQI